MFEKSARIFSRRHKQTTFSDAVFLGTLRVNMYTKINSYFHILTLVFPLSVKVAFDKPIG